MGASVIAIIGSGFSGLCLAIQLKRAGVDSFTIFEKSHRLGGTWRDNTYPGCQCDIPSHLYSYSFALNPEWTRTYPLQPEIREWEPRGALVGRGLHAEIARLAVTRRLVLEVGDSQAADVAATLRGLAFRDVTITRDLTDADRVVDGRRP